MREEIVVADFDGVVESFAAFAFGFLVLGDEGQGSGVGSPGYLLDRSWGVGQLHRLARVLHGEQEDLEILAAVVGEKCEGLTVRRPAREAGTGAARKHAGAAGSYIHQHQLVVGSIFIEIRAPQDHHDGFSIRGDLRIAETHDFAPIGDLKSCGNGGKRERREGQGAGKSAKSHGGSLGFEMRKQC